MCRIREGHITDDVDDIEGTEDVLLQHDYHPPTTAPAASTPEYGLEVSSTVRFDIG